VLICVAGIVIKMARCWTNCLMAQCNRLAPKNAPLVRVNWTFPHHCRHFATSANLTLPVARSNSVSAGKNLLRPFFGNYRHEHLFKNCAYCSSASLSRTVQSGSYFCPEANWVTKSRLLSSFHHSGDVFSQRMLNRLSATSKNVHDSRTVGLNQSTTAKHFQKWSISGVVRQLVRAVFILLVLSIGFCRIFCVQKWILTIFSFFSIKCISGRSVYCKHLFIFLHHHFACIRYANAAVSWQFAVTFRVLA